MAGFTYGLAVVKVDTSKHGGALALLDKLNELGGDGWEVTGRIETAGTGDRSPGLILKRQRRPNETPDSGALVFVIEQ